MRVIIFAIVASLVAILFTGEIVGFRPIDGQEKLITVAGVFEESPVRSGTSLVESHGLGVGKANEVLCERRTSFDAGGARIESSAAGHVVVCRFKVTMGTDVASPESHPYSYFRRDSRWKLEEGQGFTATSGPSRKLINWPIYVVGNALILAAVLLALWTVRTRLLEGMPRESRPFRRASALSLAILWLASSVSLLYWALTGEHPEGSQIHYLAQPEALLGSLLIAPLLEEIIFRGVIQECFQKSTGAWTAIILSATTFALAHDSDIGGFVSLFVSGLVFGWIRYRTGSLVIAIAAHGLMNAVIVGVQLVSAAGGLG
ncbi:lysostaphin resistance A-like protein [Arenimonas aestuarii]